MTTKVFCDHCGNVISNRQSNVFSFGPFRRELNKAYGVMANQSLQGINAASQPGSHALTPSETVKIEDVDLCNTCAPIWMSRVKNLTQASDPE